MNEVSYIYLYIYIRIDMILLTWLSKCLKWAWVSSVKNPSPNRELEAASKMNLYRIRNIEKRRWRWRWRWREEREEKLANRYIFFPSIKFRRTEYRYCYFSSLYNLHQEIERATILPFIGWIILYFSVENLLRVVLKAFSQRSQVRS